MPFTATVINKDIVDAVYLITVEYTDGVNTVTDTYRNQNPMSIEWLQDVVRDRIAVLDNLYSFDVPLGAITPSDPDDTDPNIALFRRRCRILETVKVMIDLGAIQADNAKVLTLINWITTNAPTYFDYL